MVITNAGTSSAATFNFTIPRGDTGASGSGTGTVNSGTAGQIAVYTGAGTTVGGNTLAANGVVLGGGTSAPTVTSADTTTTHALFATAGAPAFRALVIGDMPVTVQTETKCFNLGADNASADLVDADIGPQGNIFKVPSAVTVVEVAVSANAGTPKMPIIQKNHFATGSWSATDITSAALATGSAGIETCAATGAACLSTVAKDGTVTITTAGSANVLAAGDWIQTKTGSGFASGGAKRLSVCVTYSR